MATVIARLDRILSVLLAKHDERLTGLNPGLPHELLEYTRMLSRFDSILRRPECHKLLNEAEAIQLYAQFFEAVEETVIKHGEQGLFIGSVARNLLQCLKLHDLVEDLGNFIASKDKKLQLRIIGENACLGQKKTPAIKQAS